MSASQEIVFFVNGEKVADPNVDPEWTLLYYLRKKLYLSGTKLGCAEGGCGACTVMISRYDHEAQKVVHLSANACLTPVCAVHGQAVTTVEGIGSTQRGLHAVQERIAAAHGSQCGFCTPGIVMSMYALLRACSADGKTRKPSMKDMEVAFQGNLCRCTGYRPIIEGFRTLTEEWERCDSRLLATNGASMVNGCAGGLTNGCCKTNGKVNGDGCCQANGEVNGSCDEDERAPGDMEILFDTSKFKPYDSSQEPIFPPELQLSQCLDQQYLTIKGPRVTWYRPTTLEQLLLLKHIHPQARIVVGNTEIGVEVKFKNLLYPVLIHPTKVKELVAIHHSSSGIKFGSSVTLNDIDSTLKTAIDRLPEPKTRVFKAIVDMLHWFAGKQIRNVAGVGGNIMTGSPISDLNPIFIAANCEIELASKDGGRRTVTMDGSFFTGYRKNIVKPDEVMLSITVPYSHEGMFFKAYKQARRREDDISIVNAAFQVEFDGSRPPVVKKANLVFGGMAPTVVEAKRAAKILVGRKMDAQLMEDVCNVLADELPLSPDAPGGMIAYRRSLTLGFFYKFFVDLHENICRDDPSMECLPERILSASQELIAATPQSSQYFQVVPPDQPKIDPIGRPIPHSSAFKQATGEAVYCDDLPRLENELYLSLVLSTRAHAKVVSIDADPALAIEGVRAFFCASDLDPMRNKLGVMVKDEEIFASSIVESIGQVIGAVVAIDQATAQRASKSVKVVYEDLHPLILTIEEAIAHKSFHEGTHRVLTKGDVDAGMKMSSHVLEGEVHLGGQEHFYLETNCAIAIPREDGNELEVICSTQHPDELQRLISEAVGMKANHIVCRVKRLGGAFGGKETQSPIIAVPVAIAALKLKRPVRCMLDRDEDMVATGGRNPFHGKYKMGFTSDGKILSYEVDLYNNAGRSLDLSCLVIEQALMLGQNGYNIPNVRSKGVCCKTNLQSNTAFRGFGAPQGMLITENAITDVAAILGVDPAKIREKNMVKNGDTMIYNHALQNCTLQKCWEECFKKSAYNQKRRESDAFNKKNRWRKRGVCILPTMFGISLVFPINQAGALVLVYTDGSVLITHGGTEMGQGLHTKMIQVASRVLEIPEDIIYISETSTDKIPNAPPTAASSSSDLNGMAVLNACRKIKQRLKPYVVADPKGSWNDWVNAAYLDSVNLSASGFYRSPNPGYDWETHTGNPHHYYTYGAACSEVEIDCLTGDHQVLSTDIVMDLGESLNPAIDIGQVEGAFMQGYGLYTLEELTYSPTGMLYSRGPGTYKIPGFSNIPTKFNVSLLRGAPNPRAVYSSKAVGEPPLALAMSVFFAIKDAITSARSESGLSGPFRLDSPATAARIRMACEDHITKKVSVEEGGPSWNIIP